MELAPGDEVPKDNVEILALMNTLFPTVVHYQDSEDIDPTPYTPGLRDSIRLFIFEHLMGEDPFSLKKQNNIRMKLQQWCGVPEYEKARDALGQYMWETKSFQKLCLQFLNEVEKHKKNTPPRGIAATGDEPHGELETPTSSPSSPLPQDTPTKAPRAKMLSSSNVARSRISSAPPASSLLPTNVPGREITAAPTNRAAFSGPNYPSTPPSKSASSTTEFHEHPIAAHLKMTTAEKASLGLIIPKEASPPQTS